MKTLAQHTTQYILQEKLHRRYNLLSITFELSQRAWSLLDEMCLVTIFHALISVICAVTHFVVVLSR